MSNRISSNFSADGSSSVFVVEGDSFYVHASGDFGGGLIEIEVLLGDGSTWQALEWHTYATDFSKRVELGDGMKARLTLSGSTSPDVDYEIVSKEAGEGC